MSDRDVESQRDLNFKDIGWRQEAHMVKMLRGGIGQLRRHAVQVKVDKRRNVGISVTVDEIGTPKARLKLLFNQRRLIPIVTVAPGRHLFEHLLFCSDKAIMVDQGKVVMPCFHGSLMQLDSAKDPPALVPTH